VRQVLKCQQPNIQAAKLLYNLKNIYMAVFPHGINVKIVASEKVEWLVTEKKTLATVAGEQKS